METPIIFFSGSRSRRQRKTRKPGRILKAQSRRRHKVHKSPKSRRYATKKAIIFPQYTTPSFILVESNSEDILYPLNYISEPPLSPSRRLDIEVPAASPAASPSVNGYGRGSIGSSTSSARSGTKVGLVAGIVIGLVLALIVAAIAGCKYWSWRKKRSGRLIDGAGQLEARSDLPQFQDPNSNQGIADHAEVQLPSSRFGPRSFSYQQLRLATRNFSSSELLGKGGFGPVYRGTLQDDGSLVAVKCISDDSSQGIKEFQSEVMIISDLRHRNLVKLRGWCAHEDGKLFLVYDYLPKGSLENLLFNDDRCVALSWSRRFSIMLGLGSALQYLHEECDCVIIHRDVKSSNVLLDENFEAKLGDFGLSRQVEQGVFGHTTAVAGTMGYMAPEVFVTGRATKESDVYSFGAVLAEVACGRRPHVDPSLAEQTNGTYMLVDWVWDLHSRWRLLEAADERLNGLFDAEQMGRVLTVALACSHPDPKSRPTIKRAMDTLHGTTPLPIIPRSKPIPTYGPAPPMDVQQFLGDSCTTSSSAYTTGISSDNLPR